MNIMSRRIGRRLLGRSAPGGRWATLLGATGLPAVALLAGTLLGSSAGLGVAHAQISGCRSDPIVALSDGSTIKLVDDLNDSIQDIQHITYTLHVPARLTVTRVTYTNGL